MSSGRHRLAEPCSVEFIQARPLEAGTSSIGANPSTGYATSEGDESGGGSPGSVSVILGFPRSQPCLARRARSVSILSVGLVVGRLLRSGGLGPRSSAGSLALTCGPRCPRAPKANRD